MCGKKWAVLRGIGLKKREFYIPRLDRERSFYGTEFEVKLINEMTQKAICQRVRGLEDLS